MSFFTTMKEASKQALLDAQKEYPIGSLVSMQTKPGVMTSYLVEGYWKPEHIQEIGMIQLRTVSTGNRRSIYIGRLE